MSDSCDPMNCSLPGSSIHEIFQASVLEWGAIFLTPDPSLPHPPVWLLCAVPFVFLKASHIAQLVKHMPAMQETWVQFLGQEDPLEKGMVTAWRIPQTAVYGVTKSLTGLSD